jgi:predicted flap endonuclease-1-like 5' DNA nuclease
MPIVSGTGWLVVGGALIIGAVVGWLLRSRRAAAQLAHLQLEADARFVGSLAESQLGRRETVELRSRTDELTAELASTAQAMASLENQLAAQAGVADQFRIDRDAAQAEAERLRVEARATVDRLAAQETESRAERDRLAARIAERDAQLAKATEAAQADRAIQATEIIDLRRRMAAATEAHHRTTSEREAAERERQRLTAELSRREAEVRVTVVAQQAAFAEFRAELGALQAQAERAQVLRAQLEDRENLLRSVASERDTSAKAGRALEHDLDEARAALTRERTAHQTSRTTQLEFERRIEDLEARLAATARERDAQGAAATRAEREVATLREEIKERDVRFRALLDDRRAVVEAGLAEIARLRRETSRWLRPAVHGGGWSGEDDLKRISGIGPALEQMLHANGVTSFRQIAEWTDDDIERISTKLGAFRDRIRREQWVEQAKRELDRRIGSVGWPSTIG